MRPGRRALLLTLLLLAGAGSAGGCADKEPGPAHLLLIVADDLGWADVGWNGGNLPTPALDGLAREGVVLERCYTWPLCTPTRAALLTGRSPFRYGLGYSVVRPWSGAGLPPGSTLLPGILRAAGYRTALAGKWHLGHRYRDQSPLAHGFEHFYGCLNGAVDYYTHERDGGIDWQRDGRTVREEGYATHLIAREAVRTIRRHDPQRPLFLCVSFTAPHIPLQVPPRYLEPFAEMPDGPRKVYAGMVACLDEAVGQLLEALAEQGMADDTLVVFLGDNGAEPLEGGDNGILRGGKATCLEGGIRVPAVARWPGRLTAGSTAQLRISALDLLPTLLTALGVDPPDPGALDGADLWGALTGSPAPPEAPFVVAVEDARVFRFAALAAGWKLVHEIPKDGGLARSALYRPAEDPGEERSLLEQEPATAAALLEEVRKWHEIGAPSAERYSNRPAEGWTAPRDWGAESRSADGIWPPSRRKTESFVIANH